jgi:hypothetical protein
VYVAFLSLTAAEDKYFAAATLKLVADIYEHVTGAKVELSTSHQGLVRVINNYCHLLEVLFGPDCPHLLHEGYIRCTLEAHKANLESRLMGSLILHLMWHVAPPLRCKAILPCVQKLG